MSASGIDPVSTARAGLVRRRRSGGVAPDDGIGDAVDLWDATARLESRGLSHAVAVARGHESTFSLAEWLMHETPDRGERALVRRGLHTGLRTSFQRVLLMVAGAVLCLCALPPQAPERVMMTMGAAGWLGGQVVSAATWTALGHSGRASAARVAALAGSAIAALALVVSVFLGYPHLLVWALWGAAAAVLSILASLPMAARAAAVAAGLVVAMRLLIGESAALVGAALAVGCATAWAAQLLRADLRAVAIPTGAVTRSVFLALVQTLSQVAVLAWCLQLLGGVAFAAVALSGLVAGIGTDPLLEVAHQRVKAIADHPLSWRRGRAHMAVVGASVTVVVVALAMATALSATWALGVHQSLTPVLAAAALTAALAGATGLLLRTDAAGEAAVLAAGTEVPCALLPVLAEGGWPAQSLLCLMAAVLTVVAAMIAATRLSHPSAW